MTVDLSNVTAIVPVVGEQTSSIEPTTNANGLTQVTVKVDDRDPSVAAERAQARHDPLRATYAAAPREPQP
jgi:hypothetical protein